MTENSPEPDPFAELAREINQRFSEELLVQRAQNAVTVAQAVGLVYREALMAGVPASLAEGMAGEYWSAEMSLTSEVDPEEVD
ncbi:hypothetical protein ACIRBX_11815 [Kitasatospora sp. NPDC096147]|uniref:hypothetical protein n=1 Tax=Kitasatospora sp. NPDC096147 TaxID=3364093 RepID=UPI00381EF99D